jgi:hypothetical protein
LPLNAVFDFAVSQGIATYPKNSRLCSRQFTQVLIELLVKFSPGDRPTGIYRQQLQSRSKWKL